jgi:molybdenum cofactor cytidylyltransferase
LRKALEMAEESNSNASDIGAVILAAGGSSRLGKPKQLLAYKGKTLLQHVVQTALASVAKPVLVVLGSEAEAMQNATDEKIVQTVFNPDWQEGMASSIRCGIKALSETSPSAKGVVLMVCDQPFVSPALLNELMGAHEKTGKQILACGYGDSFGPPVFFDRSLFDELLRLKGDTGARSIVQRHADAVEVIPFPEGAYDIDTQADYESLKSFGKSG